MRSETEKRAQQRESMRRIRRYGRKPVLPEFEAERHHAGTSLSAWDDQAAFAKCGRVTPKGYGGL